MSFNRPWLVGVALLAACGEASQRLEAAERRTQVAQQRVERLAARKAELDAKLGALRVTQGTKDTAARAARLELNRTLAATHPLKAAWPEALGTWDTAHAAAAVSFEVAVKAGDLARVNAAVEAATREVWPCLGASDEGPCEPPPLPDACEVRQVQDEQRFEWRCPRLVKAAGGPAIAVCTATGDYPAPSAVSASTFAEEGLATSLEVLRTAFAQDGRVYVADWPEPEPQLYFPPAIAALDECAEENQRAQCAHACEVSAGRWQDPCAHQAAADEGGAPEGPEGEGEDPEVAGARAAAAAAEARRQEAEEELQYQQCLAACAPEEPAAPEPPEPAAAPERAAVRLTYLDSPAPGRFLVERRSLRLGAAAGPHTAWTEVYLLEHPAAVEAFERGKVSEHPAAGVEGLAVLEVFKAPKPPGAVPLARGTLGGAAFVAGFDLEGAPLGWRFPAEKGKVSAARLSTAELCAAVADQPDAFGATRAPLAAACERVAKAAAEARDLEQRLAAAQTGDALAECRKALGASAVLFGAQRGALQAALEKRQQAVSAKELADLKAALAATATQDELGAWAAARDGGSSLSPAQEADLKAAYGWHLKDLGAKELAALQARVAAAETGEALKALAAARDASTLLTDPQRAALGRTLEVRRVALKKACKLTGADACPDAGVADGGAR